MPDGILEALVIKAIRGKKHTLFEIAGEVFGASCDVTDLGKLKRSLQALRKRGVIAPVRGWGFNIVDNPMMFDKVERPSERKAD